MKSDHFVNFYVNYCGTIEVILIASLFIIIAKIVLGKRLEKWGFGME